MATALLTLEIDVLLCVLSFLSLKDALRLFAVCAFAFVCVLVGISFTDVFDPGDPT
jgi:hypothetical protein